MRLIHQSLVLLLGTLLFMQCATEGGKQPPVSANEAIKTPPAAAVKADVPKEINALFPYDLTSWKQKMTLDDQLTEISGLEYRESKHELLAINDEKGKLFTIDPNNGKLLKIQNFGKSGDYEGIALVKDRVYVTKSNGRMIAFDITNPDADQKIKTRLSLTNDVEGLCFDESQSRLLIACKGSPNISGHPKKKNAKAIYAYDLEKQSFEEDPALLIKDKKLADFVETHYADKVKSEKHMKKLVSRVTKISPSGLAIHPLKDHIYILSSVGKLLLVLDREGSILHVEFLNENHHTQPEGICFRANGDLFISNEGKGFAGNIYKFSPL